MVLAGTSDSSDPANRHFSKILICVVIVAVLRGESTVTGQVQFEQYSEDSPTIITYNITGMDPSSKRRFHVQ